MGEDLTDVYRGVTGTVSQKQREEKKVFER
jgi:hypothetical protein